MDLEKDLEDLRKTCEIQGNCNEIIIRDLDDCKYKGDHNISVKSEEGSLDSTLPVISETSSTKEEGGNNQFLKERDIPEMSSKVYDFVMSKERTLPTKLSETEVRRLQRKWLWIGGLGLASLIVIIIVIVIVIITGDPSHWENAENQ